MSQRTTHISPAPEVPAQLADWQAERSANAERSHALKALHALAEAGDAPSDGPETTPPLPDHLRIRWEETYGRKGGPEKTPPHPDHFFAALRRWFSLNPMAWAGGAGLAAALLAVALIQHHGSETADPEAVITRGIQPTAGQDLVAPIYVIISGTPVDPLLTKLREAFPARSILTVRSREEIPPGARMILEADPAMVQHPEAAVNAVETLDEAAAAASP